MEPRAQRLTGQRTMRMAECRRGVDDEGMRVALLDALAQLDRRAVDRAEAT